MADGIFAPAPLEPWSRQALRQSLCQDWKRLSGPAAWTILAAILLIGFGDWSADYPYVVGVEYRQMIPGLRHWTILAQTGCVVILVLLGLINLAAGQWEFSPGMGSRLFLWLMLIATLCGACVGLLRGVEPRHVLGDSQNMILYMLPFAVTGLNGEKGIRRIRHLFFAACGLILIKLFLPVASDILQNASLDWRYLLKASPFLMPMALLSLSLFLGGRRAVHLILFVLASVGIFLAYMRGLYLGMAAGLLFIFILSIRGRRLSRLISAGVLFIVIGGGLTVMMQGDILKIFGAWDTDLFRIGFEYRMRQINMLMNMFFEFPIFGAGLGAFDPLHEGYEESLARPYLVELEYLNLLAKLGTIGFGLIAAAFVFLLLDCLRRARRAPSSEVRFTILGFAAGLIALMVASITNTLYSSVLFHLYVVILLLVSSASRSTEKSRALPCPEAPAVRVHR
jgi:hypothetical protein